MNIKDNQPVHDGKEISLLPLFLLFLRYRWFIILTTVIFVLISLILTMISYKENYNVSTSILLQPPRKVSTSEQYMDYYNTKDLLKNTYEVVLNSNDLLKNVVLSEYDLNEDGKNTKTNLMGFFKTDNTGTAIKKLKALLLADYKKLTSVVTLTITSANPEIAAQILNNVVGQINYYYNYQFNSNAKRNLEFVDSGIVVSKKDLDDAKRKLGSFITENKQLKVALANQNQYPEYYQCVQELQKLQTDVDLKNKTYTTLLNKSEALKLEITENAPSVTVLEKATVPTEPIPPKYIRNSAIAGFLGLFFSCIYCIMTNFVSLFNLHGTKIEQALSDLRNDFRIKKRSATSK